MKNTNDNAECPAESHHHPDADDPSKWVSMSVEGLTLECIALAIEAAKMFMDGDTASRHKESGDFRITEQVFRRVLEVNKMGEQLVMMMMKKGEEEDIAA